MTIAEQRGKAFLAVAAEIDDAATGRDIARGPFQLCNPRHDRRSERAREMMTPLAPVQTGLANRTARMSEHVGRDLQGTSQELFAFGGEFNVVFLLPDQPLLFHAVEHLNAEIAGEMIVANPGTAQRRIFRPGANAHMAGARGKACKSLQYAGNVGVGETVIAMAALLFRFNKPAGLQF